MVGWHHWLSGREFEPTVGYSEGQGSLMCCSPWGSQKSNTAEQLNNNKCTMQDISTLESDITKSILGAIVIENLGTLDFGPGSSNPRPGRLSYRTRLFMSCDSLVSFSVYRIIGKRAVP